MTERTLSELLERAGERVEVGAPPIPAMVAGAARHRRRRTLAVVCAAAASVAVTVGGIAVLAPDGSTSPAPSGPSSPPVASQGTSDPEPIPPGMRLVGIGHAAIAVPKEWKTNAIRCVAPSRDTVIVDVSSYLTCGAARPDGVESVELVEGPPRYDFAADSEFQIDGVPAERQHTTCANGDFGGGRVCSGTVYLPSLRVSFRAESSTGPQEVDRILEQIRIAPDVVAVPGYSRMNSSGQGRAQERYVAALEEAGFQVEIRTEKRPPIDPGYILDVTPHPGTMLTPGDVVTVTAVAEPEGPADEVAVYVNSDSGYLSDEQVRAGGTIEVRVGDTIWAYADGKRAGTLAARLDGDSLVVSDWVDGPNYPNSWTAVAPGRTTITLTITADGAPVVLGEVTVIVR